MYPLFINTIQFIYRMNPLIINEYYPDHIQNVPNLYVLRIYTHQVLCQKLITFVITYTTMKMHLYKLLLIGNIETALFYVPL